MHVLEGILVVRREGDLIEVDALPQDIIKTQPKTSQSSLAVSAMREVDEERHVL